MAAAKIRWIGFVAARYVSKGRKTSPSSVFSVLGIATGVLALTIILGVMNGFQLSFIESILEMSSCHIRIDKVPPGEKGAELERRVLALPGTVSALPFREFSALARGLGSPRGVAARGAPPDALKRDPGLKSRLEIEQGAFDLSGPGQAVIGAELARHMGLRVGDELRLLSITGNLGAALAGEGEEAGNLPFTVAGIFRCGFYEYDLGWVYLNLDRAGEMAGDSLSLGIKLKDRWQDERALAAVKGVIRELGLEAQGVRASSWRDYNRSFFRALRTEKLMMFILVGLIFVVVALNIFQAQRRTVLERREEIGLLRALGASDLGVRLVFAWDGLIIGLSGAGLGMILGLLIAFHIPGFFSLLEGIVNFFIHLLNLAADFLGGKEAGDFAIFSPQIFYVKEIPSRVIPGEAFLIFIFGLLSALLAAWFASGKVSRTRPAEVLRYE